ncbi:hypothetical protein SMACR_08504 [Sordaria macrospora]|uniref:WGS project CABT00000000 data, contig 2.54 n=2 Tax=Sordaria macrospora TaxID=5147 RepID=F7W9R4_SORMK|nr:uncharacterized protein SMAC_08504 [Sordaria macrospora k-hell]KAA8632173.1 hypothetical protein SMACR_08504 [Sordaria macrospora]WPJ57161.1 hypothetical protein SMAC4_08504 [Sordaria macrospora]CCC14055.1 unnamed protein product [Sordaria macrospora k-hell]
MDPRIARPSTAHGNSSNPFPSPSPSLSVAHVPKAVPNIPVDISAVSDGVNGYNTALVTELLRHKRKARDVKSCFPCRHRKVRCDGGLPCSNCVKRDHVSLCRRVTTTPGASSVTKSAVTKGISVQSGPSVAASSPRSVVGDPYGGGSNGFGAFDPTTSGQQQQQQHNGYVDRSSPSTVANHDVGVNGCSGYPPPPQPQRRGPHEIASPNPQFRETYLPPLAQGQQSQPQDDDDSVLERLENIEKQIQSLKSDLVQRRSNRAYQNAGNHQPQHPQDAPTPSQYSVSEHHRDNQDLLPRLDSLVATSNFLQSTSTTTTTTTTYGNRNSNNNQNHSRKPSSTQAHYGGTPPAISQLESTPLSRGKQFVEEATGATIFLGKRADPPLSLGCFQDPAPLFSLGGDLGLNGPGSGGGRHHEVQLTPRTYPFTNLWTPEAKLGDVCRTLPCQSDIIRYWQAFETFVYPFYPLLVALDDFRASIYAFLSRQPMMSRAQQQEAEGGNGNGNGIGGGSTTSWIEENTDPSWLALLFSVLACGTQFSSDTAQERYLRSKVFVCSAFQCLRTANLFFKTDLNQIQAMALVGHCLRNNLETNSAWILLGATIRLAQSIGLHEASMPGSQGAWASEVHRSQAAHLWRMIIWQDTFLSFTYDRPPVATSTILHNDMFGAHRNLSNKHGQHPDSTKYTFTEAVFRVCLVILDWTREGTATSQSPAVLFGTDKDRRYSQIRSLLSFKQQFNLVLEDSVQYLRDDSQCDTLQKHAERLGLQIHVASALCRMYRLCVDTLREDRQQGYDAVGIQGQEEEQLTSEYAMHATEAVRGFLDMYQLSRTVCRSWPFVHNAVSSAVMLREFLVGGGGSQGGSLTPSSNHQQQQPQQGMQALREEWTRRSEPLIIKLIGVLEKEERESEWLDADTNVRHSGPHSRALRALKESYGR